jgi:CBS-domain-containing membrane protein
MQTQRPCPPAARAWNTLVGHAVGVAAAVVALAATGASGTPPPITTGVLAWQRELASALAVALTIIGQMPLRATHPPAAATTLLITLGAINPEWRAIAIIAAGVTLTAILGEIAQVALARAVPIGKAPPDPGSPPSLP